MLVVLAGCSTLQTLTETSVQLAVGEVVACPAGRDGAHRLTNETDEPVRVLIVSTMLAPDINQFPETGQQPGAGLHPGDRSAGRGAGPCIRSRCRSGCVGGVHSVARVVDLRSRTTR